MRSSPALGDLNGDGQLDVVVGRRDNKIYAWSGDGTPLTGWPQATGLYVESCPESSPALGDLNGDGQLDVVVGSSNHKVYAWTTGAPYDPERIAWGMFHHNVRHTGVADEIAPASDGEVDVDDQGNEDTTWAETKIGALIPDETAMLPNFPNPFNPETWIPFQLHEGAQVTITIYDAVGRVVRCLDLGHQSAGVYRTAERASHWDGRNDDGETVGSGAYFAELVAGDYRKIRRIVLLK